MEGTQIVRLLTETLKVNDISFREGLSAISGMMISQLIIIDMTKAEVKEYLDILYSNYDEMKKIYNDEVKEK
jgi:hypothetical protein